MAGQHLDFPEIRTDVPLSRKRKSFRRQELEFSLGVLFLTALFAATCLWVLWNNQKSSQAPASPAQPAREVIVVKSAREPVPVIRLKTYDLSTPRDRTPFVAPSSQVPLSRMDELIFAKLKEHKIEPADPCSDAVFLRRIFIDVLGCLPTADEAREFLDSKNPAKRQTLIEEALSRPEYADYLAMKWSDIFRIKAEFPIKLWPNAAQAYHRWIRTTLHENLPYDQFVRELLTSSGSNFRTPQVNFYRAVQSRTPQGFVQAVALSFLCERTDGWPEERVDGMAQFFSQLGFKPTGEWKEEIVYFDQRQSLMNRESKLEGVLPDRTSVEIPPGQDPRTVFADWLLEPENPAIAKAFVNRVCYWLLGRGIVNPVDDMGPHNPPSHPELLDYLAKEFIQSGYDVKGLYRRILNSRAYQLSCIPQSDDPQAGELFAYYPIRRLDAEVLIDAICQITQVPETYSSIIPEPFTFLPEGTRAVALPDGSITSSFLEMFGRPTRDTGLEEDRNNRLSAAQSLHLLNSNHIRNKLKNGPGIAKILAGAWESLTTSTDSLFLAILSRRPTEEERNAVVGMCSNVESAKDVAWALINSDEFLYRH
ncbi:MAG: DUF1553 domain-containing protein [Planctomycetaceae bacterium]|nr:DUF1553 domain-containing protein [Planctomycetaceae bacterium]